MRTRTALLTFTLLGLVSLVAQTATAQSQRPRTLRHILDTMEPDLKFTDVPLTDALDYIRDTNDINVVVDWKSLEAVNIDRNATVNVHLHNVTLRKALNVILNEAGAGNVLTFYVQDNVLNITTQAKADTVMYLKVYDVQDLLISIPQFQLSDVTQVASGLSTGGSGTSVGGSSAGGGGGQSLGNSSSGGSSFTGGNTGNSTNSQTPQQMGDDLVKLITDNVRPEIWKTNGGTANISFYNGMLVVNAPLSVQEAIGGPVD
jgi:hypothetical protein